MLMSKNFKDVVIKGQDIAITREGVAGQLIIPADLQQRMLYDANIVGSQIVFSEGDSMYILTDEFGFVNNYEEVEANIFMVDGGVAIELIDGKLLLKGANGEHFIVDETGDIDYPNARSRTHMVTADAFRQNAIRVIQNRYGTPDAELAGTYVDNLMMNCTFSYATIVGEPVYSMRIVQQYEDLGIKKFEFFNFHEAAEYETEDEEEVDLNNLVDVDEEEEKEDDHDYKMDGEEVVEEDFATSF